MVDEMVARAGAIVPVVLCGGTGTRLWPASRGSMPKQFIPLVGTLSSFQETVRRLDGPVFSRPVVIASDESRFVVAEQLREAGVEADIVLEPVPRDSAAAVAVATCLALARGPGTLVLTVAADHLVGDAEAFVQACVDAAAGARLGRVMAMGVVPTSPATGYGYIRVGVRLDGGGFDAAAFVEKPDPSTARHLVDDGLLWNSGNFLFSAGTMEAEFEAHAPDVLSAARDAVAMARVDLDFTRLDAEAFGRSPAVSFDRAVMERTRNAGVVPVDFPWSDVSTWGAVHDASARDASGNVLRGDVEVLDTRDSLVHGDGVLTTVVGMRDVVVVATPDAVLVAPRHGSEAVKGLVARLRSSGRREVDEHRVMYRPWGSYQCIDAGTRFQVKRITVKPGQRLSLQKHFHRAEHWVVVRGTAEVTVDDTVTLRHENEAAYLPIGSVHRLANPGRIDLELIEVQVGSYTGEDDIVRFEDIYGR